MHVSGLAALLSMLALSCQRSPAFMSQSAVQWAAPLFTLCLEGGPQTTVRGGGGGG
jgi:hypothetical protein